MSRLRIICATGMAAVMLLAMVACVPAAAFQEREIGLSDAPLSLEQAILIAKENNRQIHESIHDFNVAQRKIVETRSQFGFNLKMDGNWIRQHDSSAFSLLTYNPMDISGSFAPGALANPANPLFVASPIPSLTSIPLSKRYSHSMDLTFSKPLLTFGLKPESMRLNRRARDVSELEVSRLELDVANKTNDSFFNYLLAKQSVAVMAKTLKRAEDHLDAAKKRFEQGTVAQFDVIRAEVEVKTAQENLAQAETGMNLARMALNNVLGLPVERATELRFEPSEEIDLAMQPVDKYVDYAVHNRIELRQIQLGQEQARIGSRLAKNRPMLNFALLYNVLNSGSSLSAAHTFRYVLSYSYDLYDSGVSRARRSQALEQAEKLGLTEIDAREGIILQTQQAYLNVVDSQKRLETSKAIMLQATTAREMADVGHAQGVTSEIDWKDALLGEEQAALNLAKNQYDLETAKAKLANALGFETMADVAKAVK